MRILVLPLSEEIYVLLTNFAPILLLRSVFFSSDSVDCFRINQLVCI